MKLDRFFKQFNWRFVLVRVLVNAIALAVTAAVVPKIYFVDKSIWNWLFMAILLGILNAVVKPILQFLTLQFLFVTYGLTVVVVNTLILLLLSFLFPGRFAVDNLLWAFVGGLVLGLLSSFLESLLGLTMPIVPDEPPDLRQQLEEKAHPGKWFAAKNNEAGLDERALVAGPVISSGTSTLVEEGQGREDLTPPSGPEGGVPQPLPSEPDEQLVTDDNDAPREEGASPLEADLAASVETHVKASSEMTTSIDTEPVPEPQQEAEEDPS